VPPRRGRRCARWPCRPDRARRTPRCAASRDRLVRPVHFAAADPPWARGVARVWLVRALRSRLLADHRLLARLTGLGHPGGHRSSAGSSSVPEGRPGNQSSATSAPRRENCGPHRTATCMAATKRRRPGRPAGQARAGAVCPAAGVRAPRIAASRAPEATLVTADSVPEIDPAASLRYAAGSTSTPCPGGAVGGGQQGTEHGNPSEAPIRRICC